LTKKPLILILILIFLVTLVSCKEERGCLYLVSSPSQVTAFYKTGRVLTELTFSPDTIRTVARNENLATDALFKGLYGEESLSVKQLDDESYRLLFRLLSSLSAVRGEESGAATYALMEKDLRKTSFNDTIKPLTEDGDGKSFLSLADKNVKTIKLSGDEFLSHAAPWEERTEFFQNWIAELGVYL
jgi:hypothetical protein